MRENGERPDLEDLTGGLTRGLIEDVIGIVTDSSCDLPRHLLERFHITVVPLNVHLGTECYSDGDLLPEAFWEKVAQVDATPKTSQPSLGVFEAVFERLVDQGKQVLCLTLTAKHSGTFSTAHMAAQRFGEAVQAFDSQSLSLGLGFQVLEAARAVEAGRSMQELLMLLEDVRSRVRTMVVLDTLESVRSGGRADAFIAVADRMTRLLNVKPIVNFVEGRVQLLGVARSFGRAVERILDMVEELGSLERLAVAHAHNRAQAEELADRLAERLLFPRDAILVRETGAVVASHAGLGAVGAFALPRGRV